MLCKTAVSRAVKTIFFAMTIPLLAACDVEQRLSWSPDGTKLAIVGADGVRVSTDGGTSLSEPVEPNAKLLSWFPDSKRLMVLSEVTYDSWEEAEKHLSKEDLEAIKSCAGQLINQLDKCNGDLAQAKAELQKEKFNAEHLTGALFFLNATQGEKMRKIAGSDWRILHLGATLSTIREYESDKAGLKLKQTFLTTDRTFDCAKVSPSTEYLCLITAKDNALQTLETKNVKAGWKQFGKDFKESPDWDVDTDIVYGIRSVNQKTKGKPDGELVSINVKKAPAQAVKHLSDVYSAYDKVRATVDSNVLFVAFAAGNLPSTKNSCLFSYNIASGKLKRLVTRAKGDELEKFEVSPDGKFVSIPGSKGALDILNLQSGKRKKVTQAISKEELDTFTPVWRNNEELCFNNFKPDLSSVALYSTGTGQIKNISAGWPAKATAGLLGRTDKSLSFEDFLQGLRENAQ